MRDAVTLRVRALDPECTTVHRWRNFGESVWLRYRDEPRVDCDLGEIDASTERSHISVRTGLQGRVRRMIEEVAAAHLMVGEVAIESADG